MSVSNATVGALAFSSLTLIISLYALYSIYNDVQSIWGELDAEMSQFKAQTDDIWTQMLNMGAATPSTRQRRQGKEQYGGYEAQGVNAGPVCSCQSGNGRGDDDFGTGGCPRGPSGVLGATGIDGLPGIDGLDGHDGEDAEDWQNAPFNGCITCPPGKPGAHGEKGKPGVRGMRGARGTPGSPGSDGNPGTPGQMGPPGAPGEDGKMGAPGPKGNDFEQPVPRKGHRGPPGEQGPAGEEGDAGQDGAPGTPGPEGPAGPQGFPGSSGLPGEEGKEGIRGQIGADATYCPCPGRNKQKDDEGSAPGAYAAPPSHSFSAGTGGYSAGGHAQASYGRK